MAGAAEPGGDPLRAGAARAAAWGRRVSAWSARNPSVADATLAIALWLLSAPVVLREAATTRDWVVATLIAAPLLWRRRAPFPVFCAVALIAFGQWLAGADLQVGDAAVLFALYAVVAYDPRRWAGAAAFAVAMLGGLLATIRYTESQPAFAFLSMAAFVVCAALTGLWSRTRRERIAALEERARRLERERDQQASLAAAAERARIARELHDVVAHSLTVMVALADGARLTAAADPARADEAIGEVSATGREALREMRRLLGVLRAEPGDDAPATAAAGPHTAAQPGGEPAPLAPQPGLGQLDALVDQVRATGLDVTVTRSGAPRPLGPAAELTVYRVVQEALTNTLKHAPAASSADVRLDFEADALALAVSDDGAPAAPAPAGGEGRGLAGMRERAAAFGAAIEAGPLPGGGWRVRTRLPLDGVPAR